MSSGKPCWICRAKLPDEPNCSSTRCPAPAVLRSKLAASSVSANFKSLAAATRMGVIALLCTRVGNSHAAELAASQWVNVWREMGDFMM